MLKILGRSTSINVRKVLWLCEELRLPFEQEHWGMGFRPTVAPEFRALNPNGLVPVMIDDGFVLYESNAICRYLAAMHRRDDLYPSDLRRRAIVEQWMDWQQTELNNAFRYAFWALARKSPAHDDPKQIAASLDAWRRAMTIVDDELARSGPFITGTTFTLADIVLGVSAHRWFGTPMDRPSLPHAEAYYERMSERQGFVRHVRNGPP
jgi:glutathione S-transferase